VSADRVSPDPEWADVRALLQTAHQRGAFAGCSLAVRARGGLAVDLDLGDAELIPRRRPALPGQPWDLASLTKVLATTGVALGLHQAGRLDLDAPLSQWLPDAPLGVTAAHCLSHASGLPAWNRLYDAVVQAGLPWGGAEARALVYRLARTTPVVAAPGERHLYSDLGFLLLGAACEAAGGDRFDRLYERLVRAPSGADLRWGWPNAASTEHCPLRGAVITGTVHDLNAAVMGGLAPHAGLFGSAAEVAAQGLWWLRAFEGDPTTGLDPALVRRAFTAVGPGSHHLGWDGVTPGAASAGAAWPQDGVGHLGFTGCSLWMAPRQGLVVCLLSNRVHPVVEGGSVPGAPISARYELLRALRPALHTAVLQVPTVARYFK
jgi:CubicO group peptidase (beta-lactamase class C family)